MKKSLYMQSAEIQRTGGFQKGGVEDRRLHWLKTIPSTSNYPYSQKEDHKGRLYEWAHLSIKGHFPKLTMKKWLN